MRDGGSSQSRVASTEMGHIVQPQVAPTKANLVAPASRSCVRPRTRAQTPGTPQQWRCSCLDRSPRCSGGGTPRAAAALATERVPIRRGAAARCLHTSGTSSSVSAARSQALLLQTPLLAQA